MKFGTGTSRLKICSTKMLILLGTVQPAINTLQKQCVSISKYIAQIFWGNDSYNFIQKPIDFVMLTIRKRKDWCLYRYLNVCLVLNEDASDQLCTNTPVGFNNDNSPFIAWHKPARNVHTVELVFRDTEHAQIADLKIFYAPG